MPESSIFYTLSKWKFSILKFYIHFNTAKTHNSLNYLIQISCMKHHQHCSYGESRLVWCITASPVVQPNHTMWCIVAVYLQVVFIIDFSCGASQPVHTTYHGFYLLFFAGGIHWRFFRWCILTFSYEASWRLLAVLSQVIFIGGPGFDVDMVSCILITTAVRVFLRIL